MFGEQRLEDLPPEIARQPDELTGIRSQRGAEPKIDSVAPVCSPSGYSDRRGSRPLRGCGRRAGPLVPLRNSPKTSPAAFEAFQPRRLTMRQTIDFAGAGGET
jgi:hypothetical protein